MVIYTCKEQTTATTKGTVRTMRYYQKMWITENNGEENFKEIKRTKEEFYELVERVITQGLQNINGIENIEIYREQGFLNVVCERQLSNRFIKYQFVEVDDLV